MVEFAFRSNRRRLKKETLSTSFIHFCSLPYKSASHQQGPQSLSSLTRVTSVKSLKRGIQPASAQSANDQHHFQNGPAAKHKTAPFRSFPPELRYSTYQKIMLVLVIPQSTSSTPIVLPSVSRYPPSKFLFFSSAKAISSFVPVMLHQHLHYRDDTHTRKVANANKSNNVLDLKFKF